MVTVVRSKEINVKTKTMGSAKSVEQWTMVMISKKNALAGEKHHVEQDTDVFEARG